VLSPRSHLWSADVLPEFRLGLENLRAHKLRSLLTMLGMIFGVAAVVAMLSIGAGAQQEVMSFIEQLGVRNLIVEAREAPDNQTLQKVRKLSAGLSFQDLRVIQANLDGISAASARKRFTPSKLMPKPLAGDMPAVYGISPAYQTIASLKVASGRFFDDAETTAAAPVAVLGEAAAATMFGTDDPVGRYVKVNEQWFRVVGVAGPQVTVQTEVAGLPAQDRNNLIYVPLYSSVFRLEDGQSAQKDEIDGIYLQLRQGADIPGAAAMIRGILDVAHRGAGDFTIVSPAELLAEQKRTQRIFEMVMVAIASISLLVGGIGIMNMASIRPSGRPASTR
jgi:putative ABC transport system permease protein